MATRKTKLPGGLLVPGRLTYSTLTPNDGSTFGSSYTETGPRPGTCEPQDGTRLRVQAGGGQVEALDVVTIKGGYPGAACVAYRRTGEEEDDAWRGWDPPTRMHAWRLVAPDTGTISPDFDAVVLPSSQKVVVGYTSGIGLRFRVIDPKTFEASQVGELIGTTYVGPPWHTPSMCVLPDERILLMYHGRMFASADQGATWSLYSRHPLPYETYSYAKTSMVFHRGQVVLIVEELAATAQYVSRDLGVSFEEVSRVGGGAGGVPGNPRSTRLAVTSSGVVWTYERQGNLYARVIASGYTPFAQVTERTIRVGVTGASVVWAEPDGLLWALAQDAVEAVPWFAYCSQDGGLTWTECQPTGAYPGEPRTAPWHWNSTARIEYLRCVHAAGYAFLLHTVPLVYGMTSAHQGKIAVAILGGWTSVTAQPIRGSAWDYERRSGWHATYVPFDLPTRFTGGGFTSVGLPVVSEDLWLHCESGGTNLYTEWRYASEAYGVRAECEVVVENGGNPEQRRVLFYAHSSDGGSAGYRIEIWLGPEGFTAYLVSNASGIRYTRVADVGVSLEAPLQLQIVIYAGSLSELPRYSVRYRRPGATRWLTAAEGSPGTNTYTVAAGVTVGWGHFLATATSRWRWVASQVYFTADPGNVGTGALGVYGRKLGSEPVPIPDGWAGEATWVRAINGPAALGDRVHLPLVYDHGVDKLFPELSPSPAVGWRSAAQTQQIFTFDLGVAGRLGEAIGVYVAGANFRFAYLEYHDGTTWRLAGQLDLAIASGLPFSRTGSAVYPSGEAATRYLWEGELARGTVHLGIGSPKRIAWNSHGKWTTAAKAAELELEGVTGSEPIAGNATIWAPSGLLVVYLTQPLRHRYWRVRIPSQVTADGHFECSVLLAGRVQPWGAEVDWTRSTSWTANRDERRDPWGTTRIKERGPLARSWSFAWQSGVIRYHAREGSDPAYYAIEGGLPLAVVEDVPEALAGILRETRSGALPVVALEQLPATSGTLTDPTRMLYSRLSATVQANGWVRDAVRVESIRADEVV